MAASKEQMQTWALGRIEEAFPPSATITALDDLQRVVMFFDGIGVTLFGMTTSPAAFANPAQLIARARAGQRAWFDHFGKIGDAEQQADLYHTVKASDPSVPEPSLVRRKREADEAYEKAKQVALAALPRPIEAVAQVSKAVVRDLATARGARPDDFFATHADRLETGGDMGNFEWLSLDPEWDELVEAAFDAPFFPFAGADGDYVGVLVLDGNAPVVFFSHEEGFFPVAEKLEDWNAMCDAAMTAKRGAKRKARRRGKASTTEVVDASAYSTAFRAARTALERLRSPIR